MQKIAKSNVSVLIMGETGTGKGLVARAIHDFSGRDGKFIAINCSAIPENLLESELFGHEKGAFTGATISKPGKFELAKGETIFLDEIGEMSPSLQPKLLRVIEDKKVTHVGGTRATKIDVRVVAATLQDLKIIMKKEKLRQDIYYRLSGVVLNTPPLRERKEDIPPIANYLLLRFSEENNRRFCRISRKAMKLLMAYGWPGNIRELRNVLQGAALLGNATTINPEDLSEKLLEIETSTHEYFPSLDEIEHRHIRKALQRVDGNKQKASELLRISRATMYNKIGKYGIDL